jgi:hypothetical protein
MYKWINRAFIKILRWLHPWEDEGDEERAEEMYRRYTDSLG